jgi:outer membrane receptor protein involved in Fe transport
VEWLKELGFAADWAGEWVRPFFLSGNFTVSDSEITVGDDALSLTNDQRPLTGHSDFVANIQLGFDSDDGMHSASLVYNVFSERVYFAGRNGADDTYEQPFNSIDLVYSFYPTDNITLKLAAKNILDEEQEFEQSGLNGDVTVLEQTVGQNLLLDLSWKF